jgi:hypothetical protein
MKRSLSTILAILAFCPGLIASAQHAPPHNKEAHAAAWAADDWKRLESAGIWLAPPGIHDKGRMARRDESLDWSYQLLRNFPPEPSANAAMEKQREAGGFIDNKPDDNFYVYEHFQDLHIGSLGDFAAYAPESVIKRGIMRGDPTRVLRHGDPLTRTRLLRQGDNLTRGELATMVCRLLLYSRAPITFQPDDIVYKDVTGDEWWCGAAQTVSRIHLMKGFPDGTFRGEQPVTRDEVVVVLARVLVLLR